jgi:hypothetical protein
MFWRASDIVFATAMLRFFLFFCVVVSLTATGLRAQTDSASSDVTISTDRDAVAESSVVVPLHGFQMENGFLLTNTQNQSVVDFPESDFRYGLLQKTELRFSAPDYFDTVSSSSGAAQVSAFGDVSLGVKQQLGPIGGFDVSAIVFLSFPTGAKNLSSHGYDPGLQVPWSRSVSKNWTAAGQVAFYWPTVAGAHDFTGETTFYLDRQLTKPWDAYLEWAGDFPERGGNRQQLHVGTAYKLTPRQQVDFHFAFGLTPAAPRAYVGFGYSFLIVPRR